MIAVTADAGGLLGDLDAIERRLVAEQKTLGRAVAKAARAALIGNVRGRRPGGLSFSGMGTKLGARTRVLASGVRATVYVDAVPAGAWVIAEHGRSVSVARPGKALAIGDGFATSARATRGMPGLWAGAESAVADAAGEQLDKAFDAAFGV